MVWDWSVHVNDDCGVHVEDVDDDWGRISDVQGNDVFGSGCAKGIDAEDDDLDNWVKEKLMI